MGRSVGAVRGKGFTDIGSNDKRSKTRQRVKRHRVKKCDKRTKCNLDNF